MYYLFPKIISYNLFKRFGFPKSLPVFLTLSVNDWCNSRCKTCNVWRNNPKEKIKEQLTVKEYEKIFENYGKVYWITITGGEPFLREDLSKIIKIIYDKSKPGIVTIATNGMVTNSIVSQTKEILDYCQNLKLVINVSLDGIGEQHDEIRGVKGSFKSAVRTLKELKKLNHPRLIVGINTVISRHNVVDFPKIYSYIKNNFNPDSYVCEIAENRAKLYNMKLKITPEKNEYHKALLFLINSLEKDREKNISDIVRSLRIEFYKFLMKRYPLKNFEGIASAYIMHNGDIWVSYSKPYVIDNLRGVGYDFRKFWFNYKANHFRKKMEKNYQNMLANAFYTNFICDLKKDILLVIRKW